MIDKKESNKNKKELRQIVIVITLSILVIALFFLLKACDDKERSQGMTYNADVQISDDTPLGNSDLSGKITFPGFSKNTVKYSKNKQMSLQNPKANRVDFVYTIEYEGKEVYKSGKIAPGETKKWDLHEEFSKKGKYEVEITITPYAKSGEIKNGILQTFSFEIV